MQRSMSYRKPAPEYIPSPPPSPTPFPPSEIQVYPEENTEEKPVPPLPDNWREILAENVVVTEAACVTDSTRSTPPKKAELIEEASVQVQCSTPSPQHVLRSHSQAAGLFPITIDGDQESFSTVAPSQHLHIRPQPSHGRGLPTTYRPPTPPVRSQGKQKRIVADKLVDDVHSSHEVYYSTNPYGTYVRVGLPGQGNPSLMRPSPSFRTERTLASMNTTNISMGWPNGCPASSERILNSYPTLLIQKRNVDALITTNDCSVSSNELGCLSQCWPRIKFGRWIKRLKLSSGR